MCRGVAALRLLAFLVLLVAFLACCVGFLAPFWIQYDRGTAQNTTPTDAPSTTPLPPTRPSLAGRNDSATPAGEATPAATAAPVAAGFVMDAGGEEKEGVVRVFEGLWAICNGSLKTCRCFAQNDFELEKEFSDWHKTSQGLGAFGLLFILLTLIIGANYLCCKCCRESVALATVLGVFSLLSFLPIAVSIVIYGAFVKPTKEDDVIIEEYSFGWGFYTSIGGAAVILLAALLYIIEGRRKVMVEHEDCETAKMV